MHLLPTNRKVGQSDRPAQIQAFDAQAARIQATTPTMDHLDDLEAQSICIFREAFAAMNGISI